MIPKCDYHIHTDLIGCADKTMRIPAILNKCSLLGMEKIAITDHLNTLEQLPIHRQIKEELSQVETDLTVYLAVELNFTGLDQYFAYSQKVRDELGYQFAIGGIHSAYGFAQDKEKCLAIQHRHHMRVMEDPLCQVLVHPYWFGKSEYEQMDWFPDMTVIPDSWVRELGAASAQTGTAIEINGCAFFHNPAYSKQFKESYIEYLKGLASAGAIFALGSDAHSINQLSYIQTVRAIADELNLPAERIWQP
jgi:histidinol phosphatase-like PHP family hydrolase